MGVMGVTMLMRVLQLPGCRVHAIDLANQDVGPRGTEALVATLRTTASIHEGRSAPAAASSLVAWLGSGLGIGIGLGCGLG